MVAAAALEDGLYGSVDEKTDSRTRPRCRAP
ncbi:hypothetical protein LV779_32455 [Streptomyces thinghirensis]|nr:hypothetical protein [Streptomyces thinghirensis]